jgi:hypothetical protein
MKRVTTIFVAALMAALATPLISVEAREYQGPERGKMGWSPSSAAAYETKVEGVSGAAAGGLRFEAAKYIGPEKGKMGWRAQIVQTREVKPAEK